MPSVYHSSRTNSTKFTTCCKTAINDYQQRCPKCNKDIHPFYDGMSDSDRKQAAGGYYNHNTRMARDSAARGK